MAERNPIGFIGGTRSGNGGGNLQERWTRELRVGKDRGWISRGKDTLQRSLDCLRPVGMCAAYGQASGVPDPIDLVKDLGIRGSFMITRPALCHYLSTRSEIDTAAKSLFDRTGGRSEQRCQNLPTSGSWSRARVHRRTQDNGLDRHAAIRVKGRNTPSTARECHVDRTPRN